MCDKICLRQSIYGVHRILVIGNTVDVLRIKVCMWTLMPPSVFENGFTFKEILSSSGIIIFLKHSVYTRNFWLIIEIRSLFKVCFFATVEHYTLNIRCIQDGGHSTHVRILFTTSP